LTDKNIPAAASWRRNDAGISYGFFCLRKRYTYIFQQTRITFSIAQKQGVCKDNYEYFVIFYFLSKNKLLSFAKIPIAFREKL